MSRCTKQPKAARLKTKALASKQTAASVNQVQTKPQSPPAVTGAFDLLCFCKAIRTGACRSEAMCSFWHLCSKSASWQL